MTINPKCFITISIINICIIVMSIIHASPIVFTLMLMVWATFFTYTIFYIKNNSALFCFLASLFVFLLGRETCYEYFGLNRYYLYLTKYDAFAYGQVILSLVFVALGAFVCKIIKKPVNGTKESKKYLQTRVCLIAYSICFLASLYTTFVQINNNLAAGYASSYQSKNITSAGGLDYIAAFTPLVISLFLANNNDKITNMVLASYEFWAISTLFTGHRFTFIAVSMYVFTYYVIRKRIKEETIAKKYFIYIIIILPILFIFLAWLDNIRSGNVANDSSYLIKIRDFFDQQGGSINVIKRVRYYEAELRDMSFVSFNNIRSNLGENILARKIFNVPSYTGNSLEHALKGHSLAHRLSWYEYGNYYLQGHGVGSCYIAELYKDGGVFAVALGSAIYGYLLKRISSIKLDNFVHDGILLSFFTGLILAPRDCFDGFLQPITSIYCIVGFILIYITINILFNRTRFYKYQL